MFKDYQDNKLFCVIQPRTTVLCNKMALTDVEKIHDSHKMMLHIIIIINLIIVVDMIIIVIIIVEPLISCQNSGYTSDKIQFKSHVSGNNKAC